MAPLDRAHDFGHGTLGMALVSSEGIVLKTHALGETSRIAVVYTREHGLVKLVAKGARKTPSRFGFALEPLTRGRYVYYLKTDRDLHLLSQADTIAPTGSRIQELERLAHAEAALELIDRLVWGEEPHAELFDLLAAALEAVTVAPAASLPALTIAFELQVASLLGYRPRLDACAECGGALSQRRLFSPARGGLLCDRCAGEEPGTVALSADALAGLSLLLTRPVGEAGEYFEVRRAGEILGVVEAFLKYHFQRFKGLRSLELLRALPPERRSDETSSAKPPAPRNEGTPCAT
ncbi:MAG: DNA repair protein RecO [Candidatus Eisenbacteria bacterium]|uniref:DNA repair protein RecO n=1 Tax=Eiseniibacteriota bacterium TaxID=2212470 RepID=A0A538SWQ1_UNCEI|nr:MAG: DNA repair protein RecO [Candidatus Eisenbacteria bacterium]